MTSSKSREWTSTFYPFRARERYTLEMNIFFAFIILEYSCELIHSFHHSLCEITWKFFSFFPPKNAARSRLCAQIPRNTTSTCSTNTNNNNISLNLISDSVVRKASFASSPCGKTISQLLHELKWSETETFVTKQWWKCNYVRPIIIIKLHVAS